MKNLLWDALQTFAGKAMDRKPPLLFPEHHLSHAASAFYPSPFSDAAILTIDGVGEWATTTIGMGCHKGIEMFSELAFPHSLGLLYSALHVAGCARESAAQVDGCIRRCRGYS